MYKNKKTYKTVKGRNNGNYYQIDSLSDFPVRFLLFAFKKY